MGILNPLYATARLSKSSKTLKHGELIAMVIAFFMRLLNGQFNGVDTTM